jgi:outer membrane lipoprotein-sorting protein
MRSIVLPAALAALCLPTWAAEKPDVNPQEIIQKFAAKETEFAQARNNYTYRQTVKLQVLDGGGNPTGEEWNLVEDVIFSPEGKRMEKVVYAPVPTLRQILLTPEDEQDLRNVQPFVMTTAEIPDYQVDYVGKEKVDEIGCYVFSVKPKKMVQGKRYFEGQIWVDDRDLQIVKTYGKGVGEIKHSKDNQFPRFETYRQQIDGKYWFPTYTHADDTLHFRDNNVRIRMVVKYQDYKRYEGKSTIKYGDVVDDKANPPAAKK